MKLKFHLKTLTGFRSETRGTNAMITIAAFFKLKFNLIKKIILLKNLKNCGVFPTFSVKK
jgi:hypothetical protein